MKFIGWEIGEIVRYLPDKQKKFRLPPISIYFLNLSPINAKLTSLSYIHASIYICFSADIQRYHSNNSNADVSLDNSFH